MVGESICFFFCPSHRTYGPSSCLPSLPVLETCLVRACHRGHTTRLVRDEPASSRFNHVLRWTAGIDRILFFLLLESHAALRS